MAEQAGLWGYIPDFLKRWAIGHGRDPKDFVSGTSPYGEGLSGYVPSYAPPVPPMLPPIPANLTMQQPSLFDNPATSNDIEPPYDNPYSKPGPASLAGGAQRFYYRLSGKQPTYDNLRGPELTPFSSITNKLASRYEGRPRGNIFPNIAGTIISGMMPTPLTGLLGLGAAVLNQMGFHHDFNPARDSNLFYETDRGRMTWDSLAPGGGGEQYGTLNAYNMLMAIAANDPDREIQTEQGWARVGDLAEAIKNRPRGEQGWMGADEVLGQGYSTGLFTEQPTNFAQMPSQYTSGGESMTNEDAIRSLDTRYGDAWNEIAEKAYAEGRGYNDAVDDAAEAAQELREVGEIAGDYKDVTDLYFDAGQSTTKPKLDDGDKVGEIKTKTFDDGSKYIGTFKDGKEHGIGTYIYGPKSEWAGYKFFAEWKEGKPYVLEIPHEKSYRYPDQREENRLLDADQRRSAFETKIHYKKSTPVVAPDPLVDTTTSNDSIEEAYGGGQDWDSYDIDTDTGEQGHWY